MSATYVYPFGRLNPLGVISLSKEQAHAIVRAKDSDS